jgi:O-succinylbenzoate synthase
VKDAGQETDRTVLEISRIELHEIVLRLRETFRLSSGTFRDRRILLLHLVSAEGAEAWSECVASGQTIDASWRALGERIVPRVLGRPLSGPEGIAPLLHREPVGREGGGPAVAAIEMGVWELVAELSGMALATLLGGTARRIPVGVSIGLQESPEALVDKVRGFLAQGYQRVKMKIQPGADLAYLRAVRDALGPQAPLTVDANSAYTLDDLPHLRALDDLGLLMIEQPLAENDLKSHAILQRELATPLCLDESITTLARAEEALALGSARIINIKPGRVGGFLPALAIHDLCLRYRVPVWCGGLLESGIGRAYNVALASLPNFTLPGDLSPSRRYWDRDLVDPEWTMDPSGWMQVPLTRPGLGVAVDTQQLARLSVRREILTAPRPAP